MSSRKYRMVTRETDGQLRTRDFDGYDDILKTHEQIGIEDSSTDLSLRGLPVFRGLIGPMPDGRNIARYESPEVFEALTKEWASQKNPRRRRRSRLVAESESSVAVAVEIEYSEFSVDYEDDSQND